MHQGLSQFTSSTLQQEQFAQVSSHHSLHRLADTFVVAGCDTNTMAWALQGGPGTLLHAVQLQHLFRDSKHFVDMPLRSSVTSTQVLDAFAALPPQSGQDCTRDGHMPSKQALQELVERFFEPPGQDLEEVTPEDMSEGGPRWMQQLEDPALRGWATQVYQLWQLLCRQASDHVMHHPQHHTLLFLTRPFMIAGDRFRECYYWDSYWVVRGLLASGLCATAKNVVMNLLGLVDEVGHVPNGTRNYYQNRSQPPLLSAMVMVASGLQPQGPNSPLAAGAVNPAGGLRGVPGVAFSAGPRTGAAASAASVTQCDDPADSSGESGVDMEMLRYALPRLIKTWQYWNAAPKKVLVRASSQGSGAPPTLHTLSRYHARWRAPRPESYREDWVLATTHHDLRQPQGRERAEQLWCDLASAAESGWDFSSRWCAEDAPGDLATTRTTQILPVDLNAFLALLASDIAVIARQLGETEAYLQFNGYAQQRWAAIHALMWCSEKNCWHDLLITPGSTGDSPALQSLSSSGYEEDPPVSVVQLRRILASNWVPVWAGGVTPGSDLAVSAVQGLTQSGLLQPGGVATSLVNTGQQWDGSNAWPPLQHMMIEGLSRSGVVEGVALAEELAGRVLSSAWRAYATTGHMHEKYDASVPGSQGGGGEYEPQVGFGWTNGVVLDLLARGYRPTNQPPA